MTEYYIPTGHSQTELVEKRSRFIGQVWRVSSEEEARRRIEETKKQHYDARLNCWCYLIRDGAVRYSDDGEPQGTASQPMLNVFQREGVENLCCVVTRYFGGVLLGAGGLVRAYSHGAKIALDAGRIITMALCQTAELVCDYNQYGRLLSLIPEAGGVVTDTQFTDVVEISFQIPGESLPALNRKLADATSGSVQAQAAGELFVEWKD